MVNNSILLSLNYWKEINETFSLTLQGFKNSMLVYHNSIEFEDMVEFYKLYQIY